MEHLEGFDVIIVGAGTAGLPVALTACQGGLKVLILEKAPRYGGTLWISGGSMSAANTRLQRAKGYTDSWEAHFEEANRIGHGLADQDLLRLHCQLAGPTVDWLEDLGVNFGDSPRFGPEHELYDVPRTYYQIVAAAEGTALPLYHVMMKHLAPFVASGQLVMLRERRVTDLLTDDAGRVTGVAYTTADGSHHEVHAPAVVLASGGYTANRDLHRRFTPDKAEVGLHTNPDATGDGLLMAERLGAKLTHTQYMNPLLGGIEDPRKPGWMLLWLLINLGRPPEQTGDIFVNLEGRRFVQEDHRSNDHKEKAMAAQPGMTWFAVFDAPMHDGTTPATRAWMLDVEGRDIGEFNVKKADTLEALAGKMGVPAASLVETVRRYNEAVDKGVDEEFGRNPLRRIETPPFYAVRARCNLMLSRGGVKVNTDLQVVRDDPQETPIEGLYAVGEVIGNGRLSGDAAVGGFGVGPCFTFGKLLGERLPAIVQSARQRASA